MESKEENGRNDKEELKNQMLQICMIMQKLHDYAKWIREGKLTIV